MTQKAYMIGSGIGNLSAAFYLIRDGKWHGDQIVIMGLDKHGANDGDVAEAFEHEYGSGYAPLGNNKGYLNRGGRMLNEETYENLWDVLRDIPSLEHPSQSVFDDIITFDHLHPTYDTSRLIDKNGTRNKGGINDYTHMQFNNRDRKLLTKLMLIPERKEARLNDISIAEWFKSSPHFFKTNFWHMWQTTFAFLEASSAMELRRYMNRMILEFSRINTLEGVTRTPYNQYESIMLPMRDYLEKQGVKFVDYVKVTEFVFKETPHNSELIVNGLVYETFTDNKKHTLEIADTDLVFCTNGSITDSAAIGDMNTSVKEDHEYAPSAALWKQATEQFEGLGNPDKFFNDRSQSEWLSWTITNSSHLLLKEIEHITHQKPGNGLQTWVDSNAVFSIVVHWQPHYKAQKENETVMWGYVVYPRRHGDYVKKPYMDMTGREILTELLEHLAAIDTRTGNNNIRSKFDQIINETVNVIPVHMPYASALFNQRSIGDRPDVVPKCSKNLAFISQFVEMPFDMVFTEQYSVRAAQIAVYTLLGLDKALTPLHHYEKNPLVMLKSARTMFR